MIHVFLINPKLNDKEFPNRLRQYLSNHREIEYFIFNISSADNESTVVNQVLKYLDNDILRFYVVGGMGTLHKVFNSFDSYFDNIELAWIPMGDTNSFIKNFANPEYFLDLDRQINGTAVAMDYILTNHGLALNAISLGFESYYLRNLERIGLSTLNSGSFIGPLLMIHAALVSKSINCEISSDKSVISKLGPTESVFFGNGMYLRKKYKVTENAKLQDGIGEYAIGFKTRKIRVLGLILQAMKEGISSNFNLQYGISNKIKITSPEPIPAALDGVLYDKSDLWEARIISDELHFVLPKGISLE